MHRVRVRLGLGLDDLEPCSSYQLFLLGAAARSSRLPGLPRLVPFDRPGGARAPRLVTVRSGSHRWEGAGRHGVLDGETQHR